MAIIRRPAQIGSMFSPSRQRSPYAGRAAHTRPRQTGEETEAQRLAREQQDRQFKAAQEQRLALGIANMVLQAGQFGLGVYQASKDPAAVRQRAAEAQVLQEFETGTRGSVSQDPLAPVEAAGPPTPARTTPTEAPTQQARPEPITMSQGDLDQLLTNLPAAQQAYAPLPDGSPSPQRRALVQQLAKLPNIGSPEAANQLIDSAMSQAQFIASNQERLVGSGAFQIQPGEATGFWETLGREAGKPGWRPQHKVGQAMGGEEGLPDYLGKLAQARDQYGDEIFPKVVERVLADSTARDAIIEEMSAGPAASAEDWAAIGEAAKRGDRGPAIDAVIKYSTMPESEYRKVMQPQGLGRAEAFFGPDGEVRVPVGTSIVDLQGAIQALRATEQHDLANKLLRKEAWGRTVDFASVPGADKSARPEDAVVRFLNAGEAKLDMDPRSRAMEFYKLARGEGELRASEMTAKARMTRAQRLTSRKEFINTRGRISSNPNINEQIEEWKQTQMYRELVDGTEHADGYPQASVDKWVEDMVRRRRGKGEFKKWHDALTKKHNAGIKAAADAQKAKADAAAGKTKSERDKLTGQRKFKADVKKAKDELTALQTKWGVATGKTLTPQQWAAKRLAQMRSTGEVTNRNKKEMEATLAAQSAQGAAAVNRELAGKLTAVQDAEGALKDYLNTFGE